MSSCNFYLMIKLPDNNIFSTKLSVALLSQLNLHLVKLRWENFSLFTGFCRLCNVWYFMFQAEVLSVNDLDIGGVDSIYLNLYDLRLLLALGCFRNSQFIVTDNFIFNC